MQELLENGNGDSLLGDELLSLNRALVLCEVALCLVFLRPAVVVGGRSMEDTIGPSDLLLLWVGPAQFPDRGDIVVLDPPEPEQGHYVSPAGYRVFCTDPHIGIFKIPVIKRVVAREGDRVELRLGVLTVNGQEAFAAAPDHRSTFDVPSISVPPGHVFVLGDNRTCSCDSASYGPVPFRSIVGRVLGWVRLPALGAARSFFGAQLARQ